MPKRPTVPAAAAAAGLGPPKMLPPGAVAAEGLAAAGAPKTPAPAEAPWPAEVGEAAAGENGEAGGGEQFNR